MKPIDDPIRAIWWCVLVVLVICGVVSPAQVGAQRGQQRSNALASEDGPAIHIVPLYGDHSIPVPPAITSATPPLTWHGGPVQHTQKVYTIFWDPASAFPVGYQTTINQFVQDLSGSGPQALMTQYNDGAGYIGKTLVYGGTWLDTTNAVPNNPVLAGDLLAEVGRAKTANPSWTDDANTYYQVFTPPGNGTTTNYCGYHQFNNPAYGVILYPAAHTSGTCIVGSTFPHSAQIDMAINVTSHEIFETLTDPLGTGWWNSDGNEIGDICNFTFGPQGVDGSNITLNTHPYLAQQEWSNAISACSLTGGIVAGSTSLVTESIPNGRLDPSEAVSASLCINNIFPSTSGSITGTLQSSGGVGSPSGAQSYGAIAGSASACHTYSFTVGASCGAPLTATLQEAESGGPTKNLTYSFLVGGGGAPISSQNFDGAVVPALPAGWTTSTLSGLANLFVTNGSGSDSAPNHAAAGDPTNVSDNVLLSPSIAVPAGGGQVSFRHSFDLDWDSGGVYDGGVLEISINGGGFSDIITAGGSFVTGGYNGVLFVGSANPIGGRSAWGGTSGGYITSTITLPAGASGQNIALRWRLATDNTVGFTGWSIDSITVSPIQCGGASPVTLAATNIGPTGANLNATVNPNSTSTTAAFDYGQTTGYGTTVATLSAPGSGSSPVAVSSVIAGLTCNTLYHFRSTANNTNGPTTGPDLTFTTAACPAGGNYVLNGTFGSGTTSWQTFALPDLTHMSAAVVGGVMQFSRDNTSTQATVFQETGVALPARTPVLATFSLGNTSTVRKYMKVLVINADFSDFAACTFWLPPSSPLQTYQVKTYTTVPWTNTAIYFYASTKNVDVPADTGVYKVDDVSVAYAPAGGVDATLCVDPNVPVAPGGGPGPNLLTNGDFGTNALPPWTTFGTITAQATSGFLEMIRPTSAAPAGVVKQQTSSTSIQAMTLNQIIKASFQLGNSSGVRKRVTAIMHDNDFSDLVACVFWLRPGQPLSTYLMHGWASKPWVDATVSFYAATIGPDQWTQVDNVSLQRTPGIATVGSGCIEPVGGASQLAPEPRMVVSASPPSGSGATVAQTAALGQAAFASRAGSGSANWVSEGGFARSTNGSLEAVADTTGMTTLAESDAIDLRQATSARLTFASWLKSRGSQATVQASSDGTNWTMISAVSASAGWQRVDADLGAFVGDVVHVQLVFDAVAPDAAEEPDSWQVDDLAVDIQ